MGGVIPCFHVYTVEEFPVTYLNRAPKGGRADSNDHCYKMSVFIFRKYIL